MDFTQTYDLEAKKYRKWLKIQSVMIAEFGPPFFSCTLIRGAFDSAKNHTRQRCKRQSVTAKREKSQTPKFV